MKKQIINIFLLLTMITVCHGEVGLGGGGGLLNPGFSSSSKYGSQFGVGFGFDLFVRHTIFKPDSLHEIDARYAFRSYSSDIDLPSNSVTRFDFTYLTVGLTMDVVRISHIQIYAGPAVSLVTAKAPQRYVNDITESCFNP